MNDNRIEMLEITNALRGRMDKAHLLITAIHDLWNQRQTKVLLGLTPSAEQTKLVEQVERIDELLEELYEMRGFEDEAIDVLFDRIEALEGESTEWTTYSLQSWIEYSFAVLKMPLRVAA